MRAIKFRCPHCRQLLGISAAKAGSETACPMCQAAIQVPAICRNRDKSIPVAEQAPRPSALALPKPPEALHLKPKIGRSSNSPARLPAWPLYLLMFGPWFVALTMPDAAPNSENIPWIYSATTIVVWGFVFSRYFSATAAGWGSGLASFLTTFLLSLPIVFALQSAASACAGIPFSQIIRPHAGKFWFVLIMLWGLGKSYGIALGVEPVAWPIHLVTIFLSVGLCEETIKAIPPYLAIRHGRERKLADVLFIGCLSGLGFGVVEGIWYHLSTYEPNGMSAGVYVLRFGSLAPLHALWTASSAGCLYEMQAAIRSPKGETRGAQRLSRTFCFLAGILPSMALHSLYDLAAFRPQSLYMLLMAFVMVGISIHLFWRLASERRQENRLDQDRCWREVN
jgi:RsiW-degrading membrane proteinase PrsW (M82 family)